MFLNQFHMIKKIIVIAGLIDPRSFTRWLSLELDTLLVGREKKVEVMGLFLSRGGR